MEAPGYAKMSKSVGVFARNHFSVFATSDRFRTRFGLDFGRVWAPFWEVLGLQERKIGVQERSANDVEKEDEKNMKKVKFGGGSAEWREPVGEHFAR